MSDPVTVLVVDDDERIRSLAELVLRRDGYIALVAATPGDALALIRAHPEIRVAVIDVVLPVMTGFDLATELRALAPHVRIVFMSGFRSDHFRQPVNDPVVSKPFTVDALLEAIAAALAQ
ncbi:MAG TPA: response regulator [Vicinamibacterales bacterium]|nr:response regulator [Vicinamibacterales bacterium]